MTIKPTFILLVAAALAVPPAAPSEASPAYAALMHGHVEEATTLLRQQLATNASDATAHQLLCRAAYAQDQADTAVAECERAAAAAPKDSETQLWLGRALGMKASHASPLSAFGLARRVHAAFEKAIQLDPKNTRAANDLGEYYIAAPGIAGGGADKAIKLAADYSTSSPATSHRILALLAEKNHDLPKAESEFKAAAASKTPAALNDLAFFFQRHNRPDEAATTITESLAADRRHGPSAVDAASILTSAQRSPEAAEHALRAYLESSDQTDAAPVFKVHLQLGRLLSARGEKAAAKAEYAAAAALAPHFEPARKALAGA